MLTQREILARFKNVRKTGKGWSAQCPAHEDRKASLGLLPAADGGLKIKCFAGCELKEILTNARLKMGDVMPNRNTIANAPHPARRLPAKCYDYRDETGKLLFQCVRYVPKDFRQRRPSGQDWIWNLQGVRRVLYNLPALSKAPAEIDILIVEGEKDADTLNKLGFLATTCPMGAGKWAVTDKAVLNGRSVIVFPDNDLPGEKHAGQIIADCNGFCRRVSKAKIPALAKDITEFLSTIPPNLQTMAVTQLIEEAAPTLGRSREKAETLTTRLDYVQPTAIEWLWPNFIARGKVNMLVGDPGLGKSLVTLDIAARVSTGRGFPLLYGKQPPGNVIILTAEDDLADTIRPRLDGAAADCSKVYAVEAIRGPDGARDFYLDCDLERLAGLAKMIGNVQLIVIDPITAYLGKIEANDNAGVRAMLRPLATMATELGAAVLCVNHLNKSNAPQAVYRTMGSLAFTAAARLVLGVVKDPQDPDRRCVLPIKSNLTPDESGFAYTLRVDPEHPAHPVIAWGAEAVTVPIGHFLGGEEKRKESEAGKAAEHWLSELLADGLWHDCQSIREQGQPAGFNHKALYGAFNALGVVDRRTPGAANNRKQWKLPLPGEDPGPPANQQTQPQPAPALLTPEMFLTSP